MGPYCEEETDDGEGFSYALRRKLFPLSQYKFKDPCKLCLVRASCRGYDWCPDKYKHRDWQLYKGQIKRMFTRLTPLDQLVLCVWTFILCLLGSVFVRGVLEVLK